MTPIGKVGAKYPGRRRAQTAFLEGYWGRTGKCPYQHPKLIELWKRGVEEKRKFNALQRRK